MEVFGQFSSSIAEAEDDEEVDFIPGVCAEVGVLSVGVAEITPEAPSVFFGSARLRYDAGTGGFVSKQEISAESISELRWHSRHGFV